VSHARGVDFEHVEYMKGTLLVSLWESVLSDALFNLRLSLYRGRRGRDHMVVGFTTTYAIITTDVSSNLDKGEFYNIM